MAIPNREPGPQRTLVIASMGVVAFTALAIWLAFAILRPTPPRSVAMATGPEGSFNAELGERYRKFLAHDGIDLTLIPSAGAVESVARLQDSKSDVSVAIIPGGITNRHDSPGLVSLGTLYYEPLWLFSRGDPLEKLASLQGLRINRPGGQWNPQAVPRVSCTYSSFKTLLMPRKPIKAPLGVNDTFAILFRRSPFLGVWCRVRCSGASVMALTELQRAITHQRRSKRRALDLLTEVLPQRVGTPLHVAQAVKQNLTS